MRPGTTVLGLMGFVLFAALALAALRTNSDIWAAVALTLTVAALGVATLFAIYRRGAWAGFAVFGWAQFLICQPHAAPPPGPASLTMGLIARLVPDDPASRSLQPSFRISGYPAIGSDGAGRPLLLAVSGGSATMARAVPVNGLRVALCLLCLAIAGLGAVVGAWVETRCTPRGRPEPPPESVNETGVRNDDNG